MKKNHCCIHEPIWTYLNLSELIPTYPNLSKHIRTYLNLSEQIWTYPSLAFLNLSKLIWTFSSQFKHIWTYPNQYKTFQLSMVDQCFGLCRNWKQFFSSTAAPSRCLLLRYRCGCFSKTGNFFLNTNWQSFFKLQSPMNTRLNTSWGHPKFVLHLTHQNKGEGAIVVLAGGRQGAASPPIIDGCKIHWHLLILKFAVKLR